MALSALQPGLHACAARARVAIALAAGLTACAPSTGARTAASSSPPLASTVAGDLDAPARLGDLPARASQLGAGPPTLVASRLAVDNEWMGGFVEAPLDVCVLAYARGAPSIEDVDVSVYSEEGTSLAVDEARDAHPTVMLCAPHPARMYVAAHVVEGEGLVAVGVQLVARDRAAIVARALGARGTVAQAARPAEAWPGLDDRVRSHRRDIGGSWEETKRIALPVDARMVTYTGLAMAADQCVDALVLPDDDVALLEVEALDEGGRVVARASGAGLGPSTITVCAQAAMAGTLSIRPHVGRGLAAVVLAKASGDVAKDLAVRPQVAWVATPVPLAAAREGRSTQLTKAGYGAPAASSTGQLVLGRTAVLPLDLTRVGAPCARIDVVAGAPLALFDAEAWTDAGALLGEGDGVSSLSMFACAKGMARLELEPHGRPGPFALTVRAERWANPAFFAHPLAASRMLSRIAVGPEMRFEGREAAVRDLALDPATRVTLRESVPAGACLRAAVGVEGDGAGVLLRAFDGPGSEADRGEGEHAALVRVCAPADQERAVDLTIQASAGKLAAVLGERVTAEAPEKAQARPLP